MKKMKVFIRTFLIFSIVGASGGLFIHASTCFIPIISNTLTKSGVNKDNDWLNDRIKCAS